MRIIPLNVDVCAFCKAPGNLQRLNSSDLFTLMREYNANYTEETKFCRECRGRIANKFQRRIMNQRIWARRGRNFIETPEGSYSNCSSPASSSGSSPPRRIAQRGRNVGKRTGGPPTHPTGEQKEITEALIRIQLIDDQAPHAAGKHHEIVDALNKIQLSDSQATHLK